MQTCKWQPTHAGPSSNLMEPNSLGTWMEGPMRLHPQPNVPSSAHLNIQGPNGNVLAPPQGDNSALQSRVEDAASMLTDKDSLEQTVKKQHGMIEKLDRELKLTSGQVEAKNEQISKAG